MEIKILGGINKIGLNSTLIKYKDFNFLIDDGINILQSSVSNTYFSSQLFIDEKIKYILITHIHEDHIGGLSKIINELESNLIIIGSPLTISYMKNKFEDCDHLEFRNIYENSPINLEYFTITSHNVDHSCFGSVSYEIYNTELDKRLYFTGDFRNIINPIDRKVDICFTESTNAYISSTLTKEEEVIENLDILISKISKNKKILISLFSSEHDRIINILKIILRLNLKFQLLGNAFIKSYEWIMNLNILSDEEKIEIEKLRIDELSFKFGADIYICTGALGQPFTGIFTALRVINNKGKPNDYSVILSASCVPGNEEQVNNLYKYMAYLNVDSIYTYKNIPKIHASGHANVKTICESIHNINPDYIVPIHGDIGQRYMVRQYYNNNYEKKEFYLFSDPEKNEEDEYIEYNKIKISTPSVHFYQKYMFGTDNKNILSYTDYNIVLNERDKLGKNGIIIISGDKIKFLGFKPNEEVMEIIEKFKLSNDENMNSFLVKELEKNIKKIIGYSPQIEII